MSSFGEEIRRERELREISLAEVAEATKINVRFLEAIERNDFSCLPGGLYNRGIVRAYCQFIGADSEAMVNAYLLEEQTRAEDRRSGPHGLIRGRGPGEPAPVAAGSQSPRRAGILPRWLWITAIVAALVACLLLYITLIRDEDRVPGGGAPAEDGASVAPVGETLHGGGIG
jgi:transcriptional regulator with XRE-family HTH domain